MTDKKIGKKLHKIRKSRELTQEWVSKRAKMHRQSYGAIELGERKCTVVELILLCEIMAYDVRMFFHEF